VIIDTHCHLHLYPEHFSERMADIYMGALQDTPLWWEPERTWTKHDLSTSPERLIADMDRSGISRAFLLSQFWGPFDTATPPDYIAEVIARYPDRFVGFHGGDPVGSLDAVQRFERSVREFGFVGLKLSPAYNGLSLDDARTFPLYFKAAELGVPALVHTGWTFVPGSRISEQNPLLLDSVCETFPTLRLIVAHAGFQWANETVMLMRKYSNVYADLAFWESSMPFHHVASFMTWAKASKVLDRVLWGSDYPSADPAYSLSTYRRLPEYTMERGLEPTISSEDVDNILGENAARLLASIGDRATGVAR
jgi:uncharacterized protein